MITFLYWLTGYLFVGASISYGLWHYSKSNPDLIIDPDLTEKEFFVVVTLIWLPTLIASLIIGDKN
jgi:hypothetical protein